MAADSSRNALKAVVVDDDLGWQGNVQSALEKAGYTVTIFSNVDKALKSMNTLCEASVIVTDGDTKSSLDGLDLLKEMNGKGPGLVLLSGDFTMLAAAKKAGGEATQTLNKLSYDPATLVQAVHRTEKAAQHKTRDGLIEL